MAETVNVNKQAIIDLLKVQEEFNSILESLELMSDKEFVESYNKAKEQIKRREFVDWDAL